MVEFLRIGEASLGYTVRGGGPGLLVPWCNYPWLDMPYLDALTEQFTVLVASPRGYQASSRLTQTERYSAELLVTDLLAVCDHAGLTAFSVLGYSLTAVMAAWLARMSERVEAVVVGGFPLLGSYERVLHSAEHDAAALTRDGEADASLRQEFDARAVLAFYRELAELPDGALVDEVTCPMLAFWGTRDDVLHSFNTAPQYRRALTARGVETKTLDERDHAGAILGFGDVVEGVTAWLGRVTSDGEHRRHPRA